jgi:colanic acid biosynthesis glycosyl transferase WcaI
MRILVITHYFWPETFRINDLVAELASRGHEITVLTGMPNYPAGKLFEGYGRLRPATQRHAGATIVRCPVITRGRGGAVRLALNYVSAAVSATLCGLLRLRRSFDVIFVFQPSPITTAIPAAALRGLRGTPTLLWVQDIWPETLAATGMIRSSLLLRVVHALVRFVYRHAELILVQSEAFVGRVRRDAPASTPIEYVPNWAEDFYRPVTAEEAAPMSALMPRGFRILFAGNIGAAQSFETLVEAVERLDDSIQWIVLGNGHRLEWLQQQVRERGLSGRLRLLPARPAAEMPRYFSAADALLVSLRDDPVFALTIPSKLQSYLACARPVLAVLSGEGARVVEAAGAGIVVAPGDAAGLAAAARRMQALPAADRSAMGARGREYYEQHFDRRNVIDRIENLMLRAAREAS